MNSWSEFGPCVITCGKLRRGAWKVYIQVKWFDEVMRIRSVSFAMCWLRTNNPFYSETRPTSEPRILPWNAAFPYHGRCASSARQSTTSRAITLALYSTLQPINTPGTQPEGWRHSRSPDMFQGCLSLSQLSALLRSHFRSTSGRLWW